MPDGAVNVTFRVNVPSSGCKGDVLRKNEPRLLGPLREPMPSAVVPVNALPVNVNWGTPVILPVVEPVMVTSSARAMLWLAPMITRLASPTRIHFTNDDATLFITVIPSCKQTSD